MARSPQSQSFIDMFEKLGQDLKLPKIDVDKIIEHHRKNLEALEQSAKAASTGARTILSKQHEMLNDTLQEISRMAQSYRTPGSPRELIGEQVDFARKSFETAIRNSSEMADLFRKTGSESVDILRQRIRKGMEEIGESYEKRK